MYNVLTGLQKTAEMQLEECYKKVARINAKRQELLGRILIEKPQ